MDYRTAPAISPAALNGMAGRRDNAAEGYCEGEPRIYANQARQGIPFQGVCAGRRDQAIQRSSQSHRRAGKFYDILIVTM